MPLKRQPSPFRFLSQPEYDALTLAERIEYLFAATEHLRQLSTAEQLRAALEEQQSQRSPQSDKDE